MTYYNFNQKPEQIEKIKTNNRIINTKIPCPKSLEVIRITEEFESKSMHGQLPLVWHKAYDYHIYDECDNKWIDFTSAIFIANVGHSNTRVSNYVSKQINLELVSTYTYYSEIRSKYLKKLIEFIGPPFEKAFLLSSGTEATEALVKLIKMHGAKFKSRKKFIITCNGNWHGRTLGAQLLSSNKNQRDWIGELDFNILHIDFPFPWEIDEEDGQNFFDEQIKNLKKEYAIEIDEIAGFILETFQGWGALFYPNSFIQAVRNFCDSTNSILAFDEIQSGFARTGKKFGFENYDVKPDLIACGKGMGGGYPLSGIIGPKNLMDLPEIGNMSSTHSANPISCAAGLAVIDEIYDKNLVFESYRKGKIIEKKFDELKKIYNDLIFFASNKGMIGAVIFNNIGAKLASTIASQIAEKCMKMGLLVVHTGRESIKIGPPLSIADDALNEGLEVLEQCIKEVYKEL